MTSTEWRTEAERLIERYASAVSAMNAATFDVAASDATRRVISTKVDDARAALLAHLDATPVQPIERAEPVAVVGRDYTLIWAGSGPIAPIVKRHGLRVGSPLYAAPQAVQPIPPMSDEQIVDLAGEHKISATPTHGSSIAMGVVTRPELLSFARALLKGPEHG